MKERAHLAGLLTNIFDPPRQTSKGPVGGFVRTPGGEAVAAISTNLQRKVQFNKSGSLGKMGYFSHRLKLQQLCKAPR